MENKENQELEREERLISDMEEIQPNEQEIQAQVAEQQPLDLEDIMKEFHREPDDVQTDEVELPEDFKEFLDPEPDEAMNIWRHGFAPKQEEEGAQVSGDTVRIEVPEQVSGVTGDTIRLDTIRVDAKPVSDPGEETMAETRKLPETEAFTSSWEPEYEQPMGEYIAPQPIVFQPRSRLRELKRKLVAGPERRYYALSEKGVGKLQAAIFLSMLVCLMCIGTTVMYAMGMVQPERMRLMIFSQFFGLLLSALLGCFQMIDGVADLFKLRMSTNTLLAVSFLVCCVDGIFCLQQLRIPCCAAFSVQVFMSLWSAYHRRVTEMGQTDTMRKAVRLDGIRVCLDYYEGQKGLVRVEGQVEDFTEHYSKPSKPEKVLSWYCLIALVAAVAVGAAAAVFNDVYTGIQVMAVAILAAVPASMFVTLSRPEAILEKRLHKLGTVLCGWQGIQNLCGKVLFPITHQDVYPAGSVRMHGVKFFGSRPTDEVVAYCAAMVSAADSGLAPIFTQVLDSRNGIHYTPDFVSYHNGGVSGQIDTETVLVGSLSFMREMGVEIPEGAKVNNAVYGAIEGQLCGLFAVTYEKVKSSGAGMATLSAYRGLRSVITGTDFVLNESFIRGRFGVKTKRVVFPEPEERLQLEQKQPQEDTVSALLVTKQGLAPFAYGITGARALRTASWLGLVVHMLGGALGLAIMLTLVLLGALHLITPVNVLAYQLVWIIPGLLITEWTRSI